MLERGVIGGQRLEQAGAPILARQRGSARHRIGEGALSARNVGRRAARLGRGQGPLAPVETVPGLAELCLQVGAVADQAERAVEVVVNRPLEGVRQLGVGRQQLVVALRVVGRAHGVVIGLGVPGGGGFVLARPAQQRQCVAAQDGVLAPCAVPAFAGVTAAPLQQRTVEEGHQLPARLRLLALPDGGGLGCAEAGLRRQRAQLTQAGLRRHIQKAIAHE